MDGVFGANIGALIIRIRFRGIVYYTYSKDTPKVVQAVILAPILSTPVNSRTGIPCGARILKPYSKDPRT